MRCQAGRVSVPARGGRFSGWVRLGLAYEVDAALSEAVVGAFYGGLAMFWHDQTKVGNYDAAIRIPERLYQLIEQRQAKTLDRFAARHGHRPAGAERARLALFPSTYRNPDGTVSLTHQWFYSRFRPWVADLDLGRWVPRQARHTLATSLLRHAATLTHIRRYLGQVSDRMAARQRMQPRAEADDQVERSWRERALNAEAALTTAHAEIRAQRDRIAVLMGQIRDLEHEWSQETAQRITAENTTLKQRVRQLTAENRTLEEGLQAARSNNRFADRRIAQLRAQLAEHAPAR